MRFDRRHVQGPDAGFLGAEIDVVSITGSVFPAVTEVDDIFTLPVIPFADYPRTPGQMTEALGGGKWEEAWFMEEFSGALTGSWSGSILAPSGSQSAYRYPGPRFGTDDNAVVLSGTAPALFHHVTAAGVPDTASFRVTGSDSLIVAFVAKAKAQQRYVNSDVDASVRFICGNQVLVDGSGSFGWSIGTWSMTGTDYYYPYQVPGQVYNFVSFNMAGGAYAYTFPSFDDESAFTDGQWFVCIAGFERNFADQKNSWAFIGTKDLSTGRKVMDSQALGFFDIASLDVIQRSTGSFTIGGDGGVFPSVSDVAVSAFYLGVSSGSADGFHNTGTLARALDGFADVITARRLVPQTGTIERDTQIGSFGSSLETRFMNQKLLGQGTASLGRTRGVINITTGSIPSWTNVHLGHTMGFVIPTLSSSNHESQVLNYMRSGSEAVETTAVPASSTLYYSKKTLSKIVVKKTASYLDVFPRTSAGQGTLGEFVPWTFVAGSGSDFVYTSGSSAGVATVMNGTKSAPAHIYLDVPVKGKLVDISVWLELHHKSSSLTDAMPLASLAVALKSPGVRPGVSDPVLEDAAFRGAFGDGDQSNMFTRDSFILWEGGAHVSSDQAVWVDNGTFSPSPKLRERVASWDRDFSMRTIFNDGAVITNPRHQDGITSASGNYDGSPNSALGFTNAWGFNTFWTGSSGSPPAGWLNGPGGVADVNEWPTTGSQRGARLMKPFLPMLDPISVIIQAPEAGAQFPSSINGRPVNLAGLRVTRAGLRGTEISGTWKLLLAGQVGDLDEYHPVYFRQARLEITYETGEDPVEIRRQSNVRVHRQGAQSLYQVTTTPVVGTTASYDIGITNLPAAEIGRTFGIGLNTGSLNLSSYALIYRLTGTLADFSGSAPGWLLNNEAGMPSIPASSSSLAPRGTDPVVTIHPQDILSVRPILDGAQRLTDAAKDAFVPVSRAAATIALISGTLT